MNRIACLGICLAALVGCQSATVVGVEPNILPTGHRLQSPGQRLEMPGRPVDALLTEDGRTIVIKDDSAIRTVDPQSHTLLGSAELPGGASLFGIAQRPNTAEIWVTNAANAIQIYDISDRAKPVKIREIALPKSARGQNSFPCGIAFAPDGKKAVIALSINNEVLCLNPATGAQLWKTPVGVAPFGVAIHKGLVVVTEQGGPKPTTGAKTAPSAGTETAVDSRGVAAKGSVSLLNLDTGAVSAQFVTGLQPSEIAIDPAAGIAFIAETNNDSVRRIDLSSKRDLGSFSCKPDRKLPYGSMPNALHYSPAEKRLYVANAGNNAVAVFDMAKNPRLLGQIPTDWYPSALIKQTDNLFILNNKGIGARPVGGAKKPAFYSNEKNGTLIKIALNDKDLPAYTKLAAELTKQSKILTEIQRASATGVAPVPVPKKLGEPSLIKHVIYVIKENRTYDQFFGNLPEGNGEASLNSFTDAHIPNQRALARQFVLLDNYYCNGVLSADGHSWATEGNLTPYLNRAFGGFNRSYTFGDDPITYSQSGFIWDGVLAAGLSFRNYGEMDYATPVPSMSGKELFTKYFAGERLTFSQNIGIANLKNYSCPTYPGWNMNIPDQLRMDRFLEEFRQYESDGGLPNLIILYLPQDHTGGPVTPAAHMADNDLAVGRLVEAVSHSRFWKDTVIFVNEDDPQAGTDHVDGHRSICLVISPYTRGKGTVSEFYNQNSVLKTINRIFAIAPMNQNDGAANLMDACFNPKPDNTPYAAITPSQKLDEYNSEELLGQTAWAYWKKVQAIDLTRREVQTDREMDILSRYVWHAQMGEKPYPSEWAGAHGRGLSKFGLKLGLGGGVDWDD